MNRKVNREITAGRPVGSRTQLYGLRAFCAATGYSRTYAHEVLMGKRSGGRPVRMAWARWNAARKAAK